MLQSSLRGSISDHWFSYNQFSENWWPENKFIREFGYPRIDYHKNGFPGSWLYENWLYDNWFTDHQLSENWLYGIWVSGNRSHENWFSETWFPDPWLLIFKQFIFAMIVQVLGFPDSQCVSKLNFMLAYVHIVKFSSFRVCQFS